MNSREVMQQALEAIRIFREWETGQDYESCRATVLARALAAEESLGAALAEPQEPVAWRVRGYSQFKTGEPRPWRYFDGAGEPAVNTPDCCDFERLYTHPAPQRQPLTEDEAWDMWEAVADRGKKGVHIVIDFARAIERAHGIGGQDGQK